MKSKRLYIIALVCVSIFCISGCNYNAQINSDKNDDSSVASSTTLTQKNSSVNETSSEIKTKDPFGKDFNGEVSDQIVRIVKAYKTGDTSVLTDSKDTFILNSAVKIINKVIKPDMSEVQKEKAIHDYIVKNNKYDTDELSDFKQASPDSFTLYGFFKNGKSVCLGYTQSFQLFMDMLDIKCITLHSAANGGEEHAWNMVMLDGEWYHVDVTWDDPIPDMGNKTSYDFFNVTNSYMKKTHHEWDEYKFPKATATKYSAKNVK